MKINKFFFSAMLVALFAGGCNTDISTDEIASQLTFEARCGLSQGIPLTATQAEKIKAFMTIVNSHDSNYKDEIKEGGKYNALVGENLNVLDERIQSFWKILGNEGTLYYNSAMMQSVYKYAYAYFDRGNKDKIYCACGYEFCDDDTACYYDQKTKMPACSANTSLDSNLEGVFETSCPPLNISKTSLIDVLMTHQMPILQKLADYRNFVTGYMEYDGIIQECDENDTDCEHDDNDKQLKYYKIPNCTMDKLNPNTSKDEKCKKYGFGMVSQYRGTSGIMTRYSEDIGQLNQLLGTAKELIGSLKSSQIEIKINDDITKDDVGISTNLSDLNASKKCNAYDSLSENDKIVCDSLKTLEGINSQIEKTKPRYFSIKKIYDSATNEVFKDKESFQNILRSINDNIAALKTVSGRDNEKLLLNCAKYNESASSNLYSEEDCKTAISIYSFIINCINVSDKLDTSACLGYNDKNYYYEEYKNEKNETVTDYHLTSCRDSNGQRYADVTKTCLGEAYIPGSSNISSEQYFKSMRSIAEEQVKVLKSDFNYSRSVEDYLIDQVMQIYGKNITTMQQQVGRVRTEYQRYKSQQISADEFSETLFGALQGFLGSVYTSSTQEEEVLAENHRQFFGWITVSAMSNPDIDQLYKATFKARLDCIDNISPIGDPSGTKKYCSTRSDLKYNVSEIISAMKKDKANVVKMADALIMNSKLSFDIGDDRIEIISPTSNNEVYETYNYKTDKNAKRLPLKADWVILRCPQNASCLGKTGQCGYCTNGEVNGKNEICKSGTWQPNN